MIITINNDWRFRTDPLQWILERRIKPTTSGTRAKHSKEWAPEGYFGNLAPAFDILLQRRIFCS